MPRPRPTSRWSLATCAVWAGEPPGAAGEPTQTPIVQSVGFGYGDLTAWQAVARGERPGHIYSRNTNPTVAALEEKISALEGGAAACAFASGMAAISNTLLALLRPGDRVVAIADTYGGTHALFEEILPRFGFAVEIRDTLDSAGLAAAAARGCRVLYLETPTNPTLKLVDIVRLARAAHTAGALVIVDNTFATPLNQLPLALGADIVVHSASKFLGGHADALGGLVCGGSREVRTIFRFREITGAALDPFAAYLLLRGMKTLALRVARQNENALRLARWLEGRRQVARVWYPGLRSHPQHRLARRQMPGGYGGVLSFELRGGSAAVGRLLPRLRLAHRAANLGAVETTVGTPATTSHVEVSEATRRALGLPPGLVRYSCGIEDARDLISDLEQALRPR